jgi:uncharacterized protein YndB with AHSA1/START domain
MALALSLAAMPTARASRRIAAPADELWRIVSDPYHLPRWWPRVERVEDVDGGAFTEVMKTRAGKTVRADFAVVAEEPGSGTMVWRQQLEGTPFAGVLSHSETELHVVELGGSEPSCEVTIELRQELSGRPPAEAEAPAKRRRRTPSLGGWLLRRAASRQLEDALDGLEQISG